MSKAVFTDFVEIPKEYVLVNPTDEAIEFGYGGETRTVPPTNKVTKPHAKFDDVPHSAKDEDGEFIPGTLLLKDLYGPHSFALGGEEKVWDAAQAIRHCLGIDVKTGVATGKYAERGLTVAPRVYTRAIIEQLKAAGRIRYNDWRVQAARAVVEAHDARNFALQKAGMPSLPGDESYRKALLIIGAANKMDEKLVADSMGMDVPAEGSKTGSVADGVEFMSSTDKQALLDKLMGDKEAKKLLDEKYYIRELNGPKDPKKKAVVATV